VRPHPRLLLGGTVALAAWLALALALFGFPQLDSPGRADAAVVLAGSPHRLPVGLELVEEGAARALAVSLDPDVRDPSSYRICRAGVEGVEVACFIADPYSTRGEARAVARLAAERGWDSVVVVTSRFHVFRSELLLERCFGGDIRMVEAPVDWWRWPRALVNETAKLGYALVVARGC
jgi:uncharacterized SAM-binding protein YcdF (DUF218 family)